MSFLIDENLSWRLVRMLEDEFPDCRHVTSCGLERADDAAIRDYARRNSLALLSKDDDMRALVEARGVPPMQRVGCMERKRYAPRTDKAGGAYRPLASMHPTSPPSRASHSFANLAPARRHRAAGLEWE